LQAWFFARANLRFRRLGKLEKLFSILLNACMPSKLLSNSSISAAAVLCAAWAAKVPKRKRSAAGDSALLSALQRLHVLLFLNFAQCP
jgi:hypothetical protein